MEIKPTYVTFEQAKLLFEKGLDIISKQSSDTREGKGYIPSYMAYFDYSLLRKQYPEVYKDEIVLDIVSPNSSLFRAIESFYSGHDNILPTYHALEQWQVVEWLRVKHGIWISVSCDLVGYYAYYSIDATKYVNSSIQKGWINGGNALKSPQEAYSAAFDYVLTKLIK